MTLRRCLVKRCISKLPCGINVSPTIEKRVYLSKIASDRSNIEWTFTKAADLIHVSQVNPRKCRQVLLLVTL